MNSKTVINFNDIAVQEVNRLMEPQDDMDNITRLKRKINNLLWEELPADTTMAEAEVMACHILQKIRP